MNKKETIKRKNERNMKYEARTGFDVDVIKLKYSMAGGLYFETASTII